MFHTPLAGVVFAMEVVMMEYTVVGFAPVILAAVSATALSTLVYGAQPAFLLPPVSLGSLIELPYILLLGLLIGGLSTAFIFMVRETAARLGFLPVWVRMTLAGLVVGLLAIPAPQIMSIGYDTVNTALIGELALGLMVLVMVCKIVATAGCVGLGIPGGMIGPVFFVGALAGGALGIVGHAIAPTDSSSSGLYALLGMGAMMAGTLQAPLAALTAILELTGNPNVIMPGMLAVIAATITARAVFGQPSVYHALMRARGLDVRNDPVVQSLRRTGVGAVMNEDFIALEHHCARERAQQALAGNPEWILVRGEAGYQTMLLAVDLAHALTEDQEAAAFDLLAIPGERRQVTSIDLQANLQEALDKLNASSVEALYVSRPVAPGIEHVYGVLTRERIERSYRYS
jgi:hypothetical protein